TESHVLKREWIKGAGGSASPADGGPSARPSPLPPLRCVKGEEGGPRLNRDESRGDVAQTFLSAGCGDILVPTCSGLEDGGLGSPPSREPGRPRPERLKRADGLQSCPIAPPPTRRTWRSGQLADRNVCATAN